MRAEITYHSLTRGNVKTFGYLPGYLPFSLPPNLGSKTGKYPGRTKIAFITIEDQYEILYELSIVPTSTTLDDFEGLLYPGKYPESILKVFTLSLYQICEITRNVEKIRTKMGNNTVF